MSNFQKEISKKYQSYIWTKGKLKNGCVSKDFKLHQTQNFLSDYFTPDNLGVKITRNNIDTIKEMEKIKPDLNQKGMILYHSVGAGKTCAAISIASNFDSQGYRILWVTRNSLRQVMYQNIFDQICHPAIKRKELKNSDRSKMAYFNRVTNHNWLRPISYRSFSNIAKKKSQLYRELVHKNGRVDPLRNTLIIVDESHNLSSTKPHGLSKLEKPIIADVKKLIYNSYEKSGNASCRLLLLSATPGLNGMMGLINLLNYLNPDKSSRLPEKQNDFAKKFLKKDLKDFNKTGRKKFHNLTKKYVSFLDRTKDYNMFAQKAFYNLEIQMTNPQRDNFEKCKKLKNKKIDCMKNAIVWNTTTRKTTYRFEHSNFDPKELKQISKSVATKFIKLLEKIKKLDNADKKPHKHVIFVDEPKYVKILTSFLKANGFDFVLEGITKKRGKSHVRSLALPELKKSKKNRFAIFTKGTIYQRNVSRKLVTKVNKLFNSRPDNIHGEKLRFLIIDKNYLEGVSFFDVKHFHILTEPNTEFEMEQLVGRVVRTCGHKGLPFGKKGWKINIYIYNSFHKKTNYDKLIKQAIEESLSKDEKKKVKIQNLIIKEMKDNAFDKLLTRAIH